MTFTKPGKPFLFICRSRGRRRRLCLSSQRRTHVATTEEDQFGLVTNLSHTKLLTRTKGYQTCDIPDSPGCPVLPILLTYPPVFLQLCFHGNRWCVPPLAQAVWPAQFQFLTERSAPVPFPKETSVIQRFSNCNTRPDYHTTGSLSRV